MTVSFSKLESIINSFLKIHLYVHLFLCIYIDHVVSQVREFQVAVDWLKLVLGTELGSCPRVASSLTINPTL